MLINKSKYDLGSLRFNVWLATDVFPVPTGPTSNTGLKESMRVDTKNWYLTVSTVGTIIL